MGLTIRFSLRLLIIIFFMASTTSLADVINIKIPNRGYASAEYAKGEPGNAAILLLHGFLQTHNFQTVSRLTNYLADEGYTVLAPTLTLGVSNRKKSLSCEAIHMHSMYDDQYEIDFWVKWLNAAGHKNVLLIGHSYGSLQLLIYAATSTGNANVRKVIATSLVDSEHNVSNEVNQRQIESAQQLLQQNNNALKSYRLNYCKKYVSPPAAFVSYAVWNRAKIIELLNSTATPVYIIMGSNDKRVDHNWPETLRQASANVITVEGANHFFDAEHEFDLVDSVMALINNKGE